ncbi:hypothetical protein [Solirhodobacter olei]|uniref:hypothetical protein n=1 Tax=Solirhodobacter olei TaxID=2493082 RepID=UPI000FD7A16B|nr:hypothetical protein [Solirhodobacter olei]
MSDADDLRHLVSLLPPEDNARLLEVTNQLSQASAALGVDVDTDSLLSVEAVRLAVLAGLEFRVDEALAQLKNVPAVAERLKARSDDAKARREISEYAQSLPRDKRISYARSLGGIAAGKPGNADSGNVPDLSTINSIKDRATRLALARRAGLA